MTLFVQIIYNNRATVDETQQQLYNCEYSSVYFIVNKQCLFEDDINTAVLINININSFSNEFAPYLV